MSRILDAAVFVRLSGARDNGEVVSVEIGLSPGPTFDQVIEAAHATVDGPRHPKDNGVTLWSDALRYHMAEKALRNLLDD